jgi:hypothetical protein
VGAVPLWTAARGSAAATAASRGKKAAAHRVPVAGKAQETAVPVINQKAPDSSSDSDENSSDDGLDTKGRPRATNPKTLLRGAPVGWDTVVLSDVVASALGNTDGNFAGKVEQLRRHLPDNTYLKAIRDARCVDHLSIFCWDPNAPKPQIVYRHYHDLAIEVVATLIELDPIISNRFAQAQSIRLQGSQGNSVVSGEALRRAMKEAASSIRAAGYLTPAQGGGGGSSKSNDDPYHPPTASPYQPVGARARRGRGRGTRGRGNTTNSSGAGSSGTSISQVPPGGASTAPVVSNAGGSARSS